MSYDTDKKGSRSLREYWLGRIEAETEAHEKYRKAAERALKAYQDPDNKVEFPIWWSTVQVTKAAIYAREPKPDVRKRNSTDPKSADTIAQAIEKALIFFQDVEAFHKSMEPCVLDYLTIGLGVAKVELVTETQEAPVIDPVSQEPILDEEGEEITQEVISKQSVRIVHWPACNFRWEPAASWDRVTWVSFDHHMTKEEIKKQFGVEVKDKGATQPGKETSAQKYGPTYLVHEIWDKETGRRIFVGDCYEKEFEVDKVPLDLEGFWPCPPPMMLGVPSDDLVPHPEYARVQKMCEFIDEFSKRIKTLAKGIRAVGFYEAGFPELGQIETASDTVYFPVRDLMNRVDSAQSGGRALGGVIVEVDNTHKAQTLAVAMEQREAAKAELFETLGIADIVRGASEAAETATAQKIKGQWANVRIGPKIQAVNMFVRNMLRIVAEVICEHLTPQELFRVSGTQLSAEEYEALKTDQRVYAVDIETDATLAQDEQAEKTQRLEVLKTATEYMNGLVPAVQQGLIPADVAKEFLLFAVQSFKYGRQLQDVIQQLPGQQQQLQQAQQQIQQLTQQGEQQAAQLQEAQKALQQFQAGKEQRETALAQADVQLKGAQAAKTFAEAQKAGMPDPQAPPEDKSAENALKLAQARKTEAETVKIVVETELLPAKMQQEAKAAEAEVAIKQQDAQRRFAFEDEDRARTLQREDEDRAKASGPRRRRVKANVGGEAIDMEIEE